MELLLPTDETPYTVYSGADEPKKAGFRFKAVDGTVLSTLELPPAFGGVVVLENGNQPVLPPSEWQPNFRAAAVMRAIQNSAQS
ncbi:hypothetical protein KC973_03210 [Candidatus Saccharibacteria bacterium]|nr:hypothetical protein [Candidatus Saccharibacteria bacterium]